MKDRRNEISHDMSAYAKAQKYAEVMRVITGCDAYENTRKPPVPIVRAMIACQLYEDGYTIQTASAAVGLTHSTLLRHKATIEMICKHPGLYGRESIIWKKFKATIEEPSPELSGEDKFLKWWYIDECRNTTPTLADAIEWAKNTQL